MSLSVVDFVKSSSSNQQSLQAYGISAKDIYDSKDILDSEEHIQDVLKSVSENIDFSVEDEDAIEYLHMSGAHYKHISYVMNSHHSNVRLKKENGERRCVSLDMTHTVKSIN